MAEDGDSHHPSKCTCLAAFGRPKPPQSEPKLPFPFVTSPWVLRDSAARARQAGGQIQAVIQRERESLCVGDPAWGITAGDLKPGQAQRDRDQRQLGWGWRGGVAEQQGTEVSRGEAGPISFLWLH